MKKKHSAVLAFVVVFFVYNLCLYLWYSTIHGRSSLVSLGPFIVQALAIGLTIYIAGSRFAPLSLVFVVVSFAAATAFAHLLAGYFGITVDWAGLPNFHLVLFVQLVISTFIALCVWMLFRAAVYFFGKNKHTDQ